MEPSEIDIYYNEYVLKASSDDKIAELNAAQDLYKLLMNIHEGKKNPKPIPHEMPSTNGLDELEKDVKSRNKNVRITTIYKACTYLKDKYGNKVLNKYLDHFRK
jgi:hypothetical protein